MSLLWPSRPRTIIALAPDTVTALRMGKGWPPRIADTRVLPVAANNTGLPPWRAAVQGVQYLLSQLEWSCAPVQVVLSNHFVHYAVIPPDAKLRTDAERQAYAAIVFQKIYGSLAADWEVRVSPGARTQATLASALHRGLLNELRQTFPAQSTLVALRPAMMGAFNALRRQLDAGVHALVQIEKGRVTLALIAQRQWIDIASRSMATSDSETLRRWLEEQCAVNNLAPQGCVWLQAEDTSLTPSLGAAWTVRSLLPKVSLADPRCWLAASGLR